MFACNCGARSNSRCSSAHTAANGSTRVCHVRCFRLSPGIFPSRYFRADFRSMLAFMADFFSDAPPRSCRRNSLTCASVIFPMANSLRRNLPSFYALRAPSVFRTTVGKSNCRRWGFLIVANQDKQRSGDWVRRDALTLSFQAFHRFAPGGLQTPDQHFFTVHDAATDGKVGWLWYQVRDDGLYRSVYLCDIWIFDEHQRQGYGTACLAELDNQARDLGISRIGLHVFGHNTEAIELYQRCGYKITDCTMAKDLPLSADQPH